MSLNWFVGTMYVEKRPIVLACRRYCVAPGIGDHDTSVKGPLGVWEFRKDMDMI
jgi:hypothetical protein